MEELVKKIHMIADLVKAMMASIKQPSISTGPQNRMPKTPKMGLKDSSPGMAPDSKKNPVKVAQQIAEPNLRKPAVKEAKDKVKIAPNGQWSLK